MCAPTMQWGELEKNSEINKQWGSEAGARGEFIWYSWVIHVVFNKMSFPCNSHCINSITVTATVPSVIKFHSQKSVSSLIKSQFVLGSVANKVNYSIIKPVTSLFQILPSRTKLTKSMVFFTTFNIIWWKFQSLETNPTWC